MEMKLKNPQAKENMLKRLRRIEGQVRGVQTMITDERECGEIMQQLAAVRSAVQSVTQVFLEEYATDCLLNRDLDDRASREQLVENLVSLFGKTP